MSITKEVIERIINFHPGKRDEELANKGSDLREVEGYRLVYGSFPYQRRAVVLPGEPLVSAWTKQPVLALINGKRVTTLVYATDVRNLGESLATAVVNYINPGSDWPEDF